MGSSPNYPYKWPRHYADEIINTAGRAARAQLLAKVPDEWRDWVAELVTDYFIKQRRSSPRRS